MDEWVDGWNILLTQVLKSNVVTLGHQQPWKPPGLPGIMQAMHGMVSVRRWYQYHYLLDRSLHLVFQGHGQGQTWCSHLRGWVQLLFVSWQLDHFSPRYSKFHMWPWKSKVKIMAKVKSDGHICGLEFNWYVYFLFHGNQTIFGWDIANSTFDFEKSRSRSCPKSTKVYKGNL